MAFSQSKLSSDQAHSQLVELVENRSKDPMKLPKMTYPFLPYAQEIIHFMTVFIPLDLDFKKKMRKDFTPTGFVLHGLEAHPVFSEIKIHFVIMDICNNKKMAPLVIVSYKENKPKGFFLACGSLIHTFKDLLEKINSPDRGLEIYYNESFFKKLINIPQSHWDSMDWDKIPFSGLEQNNRQTLLPLLPKTLYDEVTDPLMVEQFQQRAPQLSKDLAPGQALVVMDVGAGKGRLAKKLIQAAQLAIHYIFVEPSNTMIKHAQDFLAKEAKSENCEIQFIPKPLAEVQTTKKVHLALSCGGPFSTEVSSLLEIGRHLDKIKGLMADNGLLFIFGLGPLLLQSKDYQAKGFTVLTHSLPVPIQETNGSNATANRIREKFTFFDKFPFYICRKNPESKTEQPEKPVMEADNISPLNSDLEDTAKKAAQELQKWSFG